MKFVVRRLAEFSRNTGDFLRELTYSGLTTRMKDFLTHQVSCRKSIHTCTELYVSIAAVVERVWVIPRVSQYASDSAGVAKDWYFSVNEKTYQLGPG